MGPVREVHRCVKKKRPYIPSAVKDSFEAGVSSLKAPKGP